MSNPDRDPPGAMPPKPAPVPADPAERRDPARAGRDPEGDPAAGRVKPAAGVVGDGDDDAMGRLGFEVESGDIPE